MALLNFFNEAADVLPKCLFRLRLLLTGNSVFSKSSKSDSDSTSYGSFVERALYNARFFKRFRRNYLYRVVLEHVDYKLGKAYLEKLNSETLVGYSKNPKLQMLSRVGSPRTYHYKEIGWISPTILRYLFVNQQLRQLFGNLGIRQIAEIGIGFGGQIAVTSELLSIESCAIYDLPQVAKLGEKILSEIGIDANKIRIESIEPLKPAGYDLVISNYAFSELPHLVQLDYVKSVLVNSKRGYLTMNSGRTNLSGRSTGKMTLAELKSSIPGCEILAEDPLTGPDNYILVWGHNPVG